MLRVEFDDMWLVFKYILEKLGLSEERAQLCAQLFAENSLDGVYSHGLNRFPSFVKGIKSGQIKVEAAPEKVGSIGLIEQWDGNLGPGNINAYYMMSRAVELSREYGFGCVALKNTNHWMRGGTYGWQAVEAGCIGICLTNTFPNMPPWGSLETRIGNNPCVIAVPRKNGPIVLDMAIAQYSYGKMEVCKREGALLPTVGGYNDDGELTNDPSEILESKKPLPIGYWKGTGLSFVFDILVAVLSGGNSVKDIGELPHKNFISQAFFCIDITKSNQFAEIDETVNRITNDLCTAASASPHGRVYYPGERTLATRKENLARGIPVDEDIWRYVNSL